MPMSSHFIATLVPTAMPVVAGEVASRVQVAVDGPLEATVIVLPTLPSPTAETLPSTTAWRWRLRCGLRLRAGRAGDHGEHGGGAASSRRHRR